MKNQTIERLIEAWANALRSGDAKQVTSLYAVDAILIPTMSNITRGNHDAIRDYFEILLAQKTDVHINESSIRLFDELAINSGIYTFKLAGDIVVQARFTFVYRYIEGEWKIIEHHSSAMPE